MAAVSAALPRGRKRKASRFWWHVHQWVGLKLSIFMSFVFLTGSLAVLSNEIDWLLQPSLRVAPSSVAGPPHWAKIVDSVTRYPGVKSVQLVSDPIASAFAARVTVIWHDDSYGFLDVHPTTGVVQGRGPWVGAQRIFRNLHRHLNLPGWIGIPLVTSLSFLLLVSLATSFVVYKKWWRGFLRMPRGRDARTWMGDFHRLAGIWSLWFAALIALTGSWYFVEELGADAPVPQVKDIAAFPGGPREIGKHFAASLAAARTADPALDIQAIRFPTQKSGAFVFQGQKTAILVRTRANDIWTEVSTGRVRGQHDGRDLSAHQRISEMADPLHFGTFGGYWTKIPWFLFGLLLTALSVSGVAIYALRIGREMREATTLRSGCARTWAGMGVWAWLSSALVLIGLALIYALLQETAA